MIRELASRIRTYKKASFLASSFMVLEVILEVFIPFLTAGLIDRGIDAGNMDMVVRISAVLTAVCFLSLCAGVLSGRFAAAASAGFAKNIRQDMFEAIQTFSFRNIDRFSTAGLVTRLTTDVANVQNAYQMIIRIAVRAPVMLLFSLIMVFRIEPRMVLIYLGVMPVLLIGLILIMRRAHPLFERVFQAYDRLNLIVQENLRGIRVVKSFVLEKEEEKKFKTITDRIFSDYAAAEKLLAVNAPLMQLCMYAGILAISWFGARFIVAGDLTTGGLTGLIAYATQILMSLMMLSIVFVMVMISRASAERIADVLNEKSDIVNCAAPVTIVPDGRVRFENVHFAYENRPECLSAINIDIDAGSTVGIIGSTGSSKTSLVQLIPRLYDTTSGTVFVGGTDVRDYDIETLRQQVALVLQKNVLFSGTIRENLRWGSEEATDEDMLDACRIARADEFIQTFPEGLDTRIEQGGMNLSGGQRQRLCLARALLKRPKVLILDDAASAVDARTESHIRKALQEDVAGVTKIIISQRISSIRDADMILVMDAGRICGRGTHDDLIRTNDIYREICRFQAAGGIAHGTA